MKDFEVKIFDDGNAAISYFTKDVASFRVVKLGDTTERTALEYSNFLTWVPSSDYDVFAVADADLSETDAPQSMTRTLDGTEQFLVLRPLVQYWAPIFVGFDHPWHRGRVIAAELRHAIDAFFARLQAKGLLSVTRSPTRSTKSPIVVSSVGFFRDEGIRRGRDYFVSTAGYSIIVPYECDTPYNALGDPIGLVVRDGAVDSAATHPRSVVLQSPDGFAIDRLGIHDMTFTLPNGRVIATDDPAVTVYTTSGSTVRHTPAAPGLIDLIIVGSHVAGIRRGGRTMVPHSGVVLSGPEAAFGVGAIQSLELNSKVVLGVPRYPDLVAAVQCGPLLVSDGEPADEVAQLASEELLPRGGDDAVLPAPFRETVGPTVAARCGIGIRQNGSLVLVMVRGSATGHRFYTGKSNSGTTLAKLGQILAKEGAIRAMALDSGGSVQLFRGSGCLIPSGDARGVLGSSFDRALAVALVYE